MEEKNLHVRIVPMTADHLDEVAELERICFSTPWSRNMLAEELDNALSAFLVALDESGKVVGYAGLQVVLDEGYIKNFQVVDDGTQGVIHISLKYNAGKEKVISGLRRVSKPGLRVYVGADELPRVLRGLGIAIISTSKGVMTDKAARAAHVGGEVLAFVW